MIPASNDPPYKELFRKDRLAFTEHFTAAIRSFSLSNDSDIPARSPFLMTDDELQTFQLLIKSKSVYTHWVTKYAIRIARYIEAATGALDAFVTAHSEMAEVLPVHLYLYEVQEGGSIPE
ncbi:uncharacterized protein BJ212DRAFT_1487957 [Suillus subaureus]|uniref:Uncharacterized protein n=1 Tax=Suillus subaureus TaxID=48587 RepID=A0A9P7DQE0_9AGAM|nr:uncharacterized protein BJ212DRAFT_1487957 [Suillus subaureus]KAG1800570.1 hypothetical protein BJ212DRAFT_1487957 [Suillus subaureus]